MQNERPVVLYVDDDLKMSRLLAVVLQECGFEIIVANDPGVALGMCKDYSFDLVLLGHDIVLLTGSQLANEITSLQPAVPVLLLSRQAADPPTKLAFVGYVLPDNTLDNLLRKLQAVANIGPDATTIPRSVAQLATRIVFHD